MMRLRPPTARKMQIVTENQTSSKAALPSKIQVWIEVNGFEILST